MPRSASAIVQICLGSEAEGWSVGGLGLFAPPPGRNKPNQCARVRPANPYGWPLAGLGRKLHHVLKQGRLVLLHCYQPMSGPPALSVTANAPDTGYRAERYFFWG